MCARVPPLPGVRLQPDEGRDRQEAPDARQNCRRTEGRVDREAPQGKGAPNPRSPLDSIQDAVEEFRNGRFVIIVDDEDRENEGDLVIAGRVRHAGAHQLHGEATAAA